MTERKTHAESNNESGEALIIFTLSFETVRAKVNLFKYRINFTYVNLITQTITNAWHEIF